MIMKGDFGGHGGLNIIVYAPSRISLNQPMWKDLHRRGFSITTALLDKNTAAPPPLTPKRAVKNTRRLIILDDLDDAIAVPKWVVERFTIASHHLGETIVCISHRLRIGVVEIRSCADWIILTCAPAPILKDTCKALGLCYDRVLCELTTTRHGRIVEVSPGNKHSFNHLAIRQALSRFEEFYNIGGVGETTFVSIGKI